MEKKVIRKKFQWEWRSCFDEQSRENQIYVNAVDGQKLRMTGKKG